MPKLSVYSLGRAGVIIDPNPLEPTAPVEGLSFAQNMVHDAKSGHAGGLRNRNGLRKFNTTAMGGSILGGTSMVVAGTGGAPAPATTTPHTGDPTGPTGDPAPGSPTGGPGAPGPSTPGTGPSSPIFPSTPGQRTVVIGRRGAGGVGTFGWFATVPAITATATVVTLPASPGGPTRSIPNIESWSASPGCAIADGYVYYPAWTDPSANHVPNDVFSNQGVVSPVLRRTNGFVDEAVCSVPKHPVLIDDPTLTTYSYGPSASHPTRLGADVQPSIVSLIAVNGNTIFFSVIDRGSGSTEPLSASYEGTDIGRMMRYTITDKHLVEVPIAAGSFAMCPYALAWWNDRLWFGGYGQAGAELYVVSANVDATATLRLSGAFPQFRITTLMPFAGYLFVGFQNKTFDASPPGYAQIYRLNADPLVTGTDIYSYTNVSGDGLAGQDNGFVSMAVFLGELYASYVNPAGGKTQIFKYSQTLETWSVVYTYGSAVGIPLQLFVDNNILYAYGGAILISVELALTSTDGVTFTDRTTALGISPTGNRPLPILFGFDG